MENANAAKQIEEIMDTLKLASGGSQRIQECITRQINICEGRSRILRSRVGIASLPDEVLAIILEHTSIFYHFDYCYMLEGKSAALSTKAAIRLSHVCQRFRQVVMRIPSLWCRIYSGMDYGLVSTLCDRMDYPSAEIILGEERPRADANSGLFIRAVTARAAYWRRFIHGQESIRMKEGATDEEL